MNNIISLQTYPLCAMANISFLNIVLFPVIANINFCPPFLLSFLHSFIFPFLLFILVHFALFLRYIIINIFSTTIPSSSLFFLVLAIQKAYQNYHVGFRKQHAYTNTTMARLEAQRFQSHILYLQNDLLFMLP